jgi:hypothetical protein
MAKLQSGWEIALQRHLRGISASHRLILSDATTPEDLIDMLQKSQKIAKGRKINKILDAIHSATGPLREFQAVVDILVQTNAEIGYVFTSSNPPTPKGLRG